VLSWAAGAAEPPTFAHDIAPLIYQYCAPCHRAGEAGPFPLLSYEDVKGHARDIAAATNSRAMPPWLPEHGYGEFAGERRLSDAEIRTIEDWVSAGAPEGPASELPPPPHFTEGWQLGPPDLVLEASGPYTLPASGPDQYWNFIFTPNVKATRWVRAIEIRPGGRHLIHHCNLLVDRTGSARLQEPAPGQGFPGMDLNIMRSPFDPDGHLLFWKPGSVPHVEADGFAWRLDPGNELVLNTHMKPMGTPMEVRPSIGLYFTGRPQTHFPLLVQLEHDNALDIPPGDRDFVVADDFRLPMDVDVLAVYPHAHYLGKRIEGYATLPDGSRRWLIRIPDWNPDWQAVYYYREPVFLPAGSVVSMRYHYDNSAANPRNPNHPPRRVRAGNQSTDEMGHLWLQVLPRGSGDRRRELQEAVMRHRLEKDPNDFAAHLNLGAVMLSRLNAQGAVSMLEAAVRLQPQGPEAHNMLGLALERLGRSAEAVAQYQLALRLRPDYDSARFNLANALVKAGRAEEAIGDLRRLLAATPDDPLMRDRLAGALAARARQLTTAAQWKEAEECYREAADLAPGDGDLHNRYGEVLMWLGRFHEAAAQFEQALAIDAGNGEARRNLDLVRGR